MTSPFDPVMMQVKIRTKPEAAVPSGKNFAGFRLTLHNDMMTGPGSAAPVAQRLVWSFGPLARGTKYKLVGECLDVDGDVIETLPTVEIDIPSTMPAGQYAGIEGFDIEFTDVVTPPGVSPAAVSVPAGEPAPAE